MKKILSKIFLSATVFASANVLAQPNAVKNTNFSLTGSGLFSTNFHNAAFNRLGDFDPKLNESFFGNTTGFGGAASVGAEYKPESFFLDIPFRFGANISFSYQNAQMDINNRWMGYEIGDDQDVHRYYMNHHLKSTFGLLSVEPNLSFRPVDFLPAEIFAGVQLGFPLIARYDYSEEPNGAKIVEVVNPYSATGSEIPDKSALFISTMVGLRYELWHNDNYSFMPEISYTYGMNDVAANTSWKINSFRAGFTVRYEIPEAVEEPPVIVKEPEPAPPPVIVSKRLEMDFDVASNGKILRNGEKISLPVTITRYKQRTVIPAINFFEKNSSEISSGEKFSVPHLALEYLKNNPDISVKISGSASPDEDSTIARQRAQAMVNYLTQNGISSKRIMTVAATGISKVKYEELLQEQRNVTLEFSNIAAIVPHEELLREEKNFSQLDLEFRPNIFAEATPFTASGQAAASNENIPLGEKNSALNFSSEKILSSLTDQQIRVNYTIRDAEDKNVSKEKSFVISPETKISEQVNVISAPNDAMPTQEFMLGYFKFDEAKFYAVNYDAMKLARDAAKNGRQIEVLALTDNLGSEEYNSGLARARAQEAIRALNIQSSNVAIAPPQRAYFSNDTPQGRIMNRSVVVRIK